MDEKAPCTACHDPHGISATQGNSTNNSHLINFDVSIVDSDPVTGKLMYEDLGTDQGRCFLSCHGASHSPDVLTTDGMMNDAMMDTGFP